MSGDQRVHVLNVTHIVADGRPDEVRVLVEALEERTEAHIELSAPWVPYSFVGEV
ncbi:GvpL/GvpF family gas vesicle protein [Streptomyces rubiginosohelvolus]|uniref:GvpL/GvpF family gas vesicle protein n=1 Tax=Streptomyces rubiginosohelvolus TaxID=67362 RepID=UPI0038309D7F